MAPSNNFQEKKIKYVHKSDNIKENSKKKKHFQIHYQHVVAEKAKTKHNSKDQLKN